MKREIVTSTSTINYNYVGNNSKKNNSNIKIKKIFTPNSKMITGFILVLIIITIITAVNFPLSSFLAGNLNVRIKIGIPLTFTELQLSGNTPSIMTGNLIINLLIYILVSYIINIILNFLSGIKLFKKKIEADEIPTVFKNQEVTVPEKLAEKITGN